jgi:hypothetical protein
MPRRPAVRLLSLLLLVAFGAGGGGFALLDAGLHHRDRADGHPLGTHVEEADAPGCHAERCVLGTSQAVAGLPGPARLVPVGGPVPDAAPPSATTRPAHRLHSAARPRAPPTRSA